jgi:hypothetical protein
VEGGITFGVSHQSTDVGWIRGNKGTLCRVQREGVAVIAVVKSGRIKRQAFRADTFIHRG